MGGAAKGTPVGAGHANVPSDVDERSRGAPLGDGRDRGSRDRGSETANPGGPAVHHAPGGGASGRKGCSEGSPVGSAFRALPCSSAPATQAEPRGRGPH